MAIKIRCKCGKRLRISSKFADKKIRCPGCEKPFRIPKEKFIAAAKKAKLAEGQKADSARILPVAAELDLQSESTQQDSLLTELEFSDEAWKAEPVFDENAPLVAGGAEFTYPGGVRCPACERSLPAKTKICVNCGINIVTGRSLITSDDGHIDAAYTRAETSIRLLSWIMFVGMYPIASEAFGTKKPWVIRGVAILTIFISCFFWSFSCTNSPEMRSMKQLMLWPTSPEPDPWIYRILMSQGYGDQDAFMAKYRELEAEKLEEERKRIEEQEKRLKAKQEKETAAAAAAAAKEQSSGEMNDGASADSDVEQSTIENEETKGLSEISAEQGYIDEYGDYVKYEDEYDDEYEDDFATQFTAAVLAQMAASSGTPDDELVVKAHDSLPVEQRATGQFKLYQLLTNAFLHADVLHLAGNLLFLMIFGSGVNALIGNLKTAILYPILAIGASIFHLVSEIGGQPVPALGASGAIMGLAGMYFILFPVHKMHMAAWWRWGLLVGFKLHYKTWEVRGFWVVLFYIAFDIFATVFGSDDNVAHWAHLGGFIVGSVLAILLLAARLINGRGGDLLSVLLGRRAWAIIGKPRTE